MSKHFKKLGIVIGVAIVLIFSTQRCYWDNAEQIYGYTIDPLDTITTLSYSQNILPIISTSCDKSGCHEVANADRAHFSNYDEVKFAIENLGLREMVSTESMPEDGPLVPAQKNAIVRWIDDGYPNN